MSELRRCRDCVHCHWDHMGQKCYHPDLITTTKTIEKNYHKGKDDKIITKRFPEACKTMRRYENRCGKQAFKFEPRAKSKWAKWWSRQDNKFLDFLEGLANG